MNYGEEIAYWFLRFNGCFPISTFVIHRSSRIARTSDCDLLAVRTPHVYEEIGGRPEDWDAELAQLLDFDGRTIGMICEVKTGRYALDEIFRSGYVDYSLGRLGLIPREQIQAVGADLSMNAVVDVSDKYRICKLLIANEEKRNGSFLFWTLTRAEAFIRERIAKYPKEKYADRMFFGSELLQYTIQKHRWQENMTDEEE